MKRREQRQARAARESLESLVTEMRRRLDESVENSRAMEAMMDRTAPVRWRMVDPVTVEPTFVGDQLHSIRVYVDDSEPEPEWH